MRRIYIYGDLLHAMISWKSGDKNVVLWAFLFEWKAETAEERSALPLPSGLNELISNDTHDRWNPGLGWRAASRMWNFRRAPLGIKFENLCVRKLNEHLKHDLICARNLISLSPGRFLEKAPLNTLTRSRRSRKPSGSWTSRFHLRTQPNPKARARMKWKISFASTSHTSGTNFQLICANCRKQTHSWWSVAGGGSYAVPLRAMVRRICFFFIFSPFPFFTTMTQP